MKISIDTVLLIARDDAVTADCLTGRGVSTSHETVAKRLGMSSRTVGTARRLMEKLGLAVTVVMGRHLSPAERRSAKRLHGGYQEAAASVRALTVPRGSAPVENFHLPRSGSVLEQSPVQKWSPTRAGARTNAAPRRKPKKSTNPSRPEREKPRPLPLQRFAWHVARNYGLDSGASPTTPGALYGGRHLGKLCDILSRYGITPDRYTLDTLRIELDDALAAAKITPLANEHKRDRVAHFAWMLSKLQQATPGETRLQRQICEQAERISAREAQIRQAAAAEARTAAELEAAKHARNAFFGEFHATRRPSLAAAHRNRTTERVRLVTTLIGTGAHLTEQPTVSQILIGAVTKFQDDLLELAWTSSHQPATATVKWTDPQSSATITIHLEATRIDLVTTGSLSPAVRAVLEQLPFPSTT